MVVKRRRIRQIALRRENVEATAETLTSSDTLALAIFDPTLSYDVPQFERNPAQASLSKLAAIAGARLGTLTFSTDLKTSGTLNTEPQIGPLLEMSGFAKRRRSTLAVSITSGTFQAGEKIHTTGTASDVLAYCLKDASSGSTLVVTLVDGTIAGTTNITGATSGATATVTGSPTLAGFAYEPHSTTTEAITISSLAGGPFFSGEYILAAPSGAIGRVVHDTTADGQLYFTSVSGTFTASDAITGQVSGATADVDSTPSAALPTGSYSVYMNEDGLLNRLKGARAKTKFMFGNVGEPARVEFEVNGVPVSAPTDAAMFPDVGDTLIPPKFLGTTLTLDSFTPIISSMEIDIDNTLAARADATDANGYLSVLISDRRITGSIDPEMVAVSTYDWNGKWFNDTLASFNCVIDNLGAGQTIEFFGPKLQTTGLSDDDRDGISVAGAEFLLTKGSFGDDEFRIMFY